MADAPNMSQLCNTDDFGQLALLLVTAEADYAAMYSVIEYGKVNQLVGCNRTVAEYFRSRLLSWQSGTIDAEDVVNGMEWMDG